MVTACQQLATQGKSETQCGRSCCALLKDASNELLRCMREARDRVMSLKDGQCLPVRQHFSVQKDASGSCLIVVAAEPCYPWAVSQPASTKQGWTIPEAKLYCANSTPRRPAEALTATHPSTPIRTMLQVGAHGYSIRGPYFSALLSPTMTCRCRGEPCQVAAPHLLPASPD